MKKAVYFSFAVIVAGFIIVACMTAETDGISAQAAEETQPIGYPDDESGMPCCIQHTQCVESVENEPETLDNTIDMPTVEQCEELPIVDTIKDYLQAELSAAGIEWWYPYAAAQIWVESRCNSAAESKDGLDKGILQYRITFWSAVCVEHGYPEDTSIFDWQAQISIYVKQTARRLNEGCSIAETISRHKRSDWGEYDAEYVRDVFLWVRIPNSCDWDAAYDAEVN